MKKKLAAMILAAVMIMSGCGSASSGNTGAITAGTESTAETAANEEGQDGETGDTADTEDGQDGMDASDEQNEIEVDTSDPEEDSSDVWGGSRVAFSGKGTIKDTVLVDEQDVKITVSNLSYGSSRATLDFLIENNSDKDLSFVSGSMGYNCNAVNGYSISSIYVNEDITAGNKVNAGASIQNDELTAMGITDIAELEIGFRITTDDYDDYMETGPVKIETSSAGTYDLSEDTYQRALSDGIFESVTDSRIEEVETGTLYTSSGIELISAALVEQSDSEHVLLELSNTSDEPLRFRINSFALNNLVISPSQWDSIRINPSGKGILTVDIENMLTTEEYEAFGIGSISEVGFRADVEDADDDYLTEDDPVEFRFSDVEVFVDDSGEEIYNSTGIRIISKGTSEDWMDHNLLLTIINDTDDTIYVSDEYDSTSVNGFMVDASAYSRTIAPGQAGGMKYGIDLDSLEDNDIVVDDITTVSFQLNIGSGDFYNYIDEPKLTISYE